MKKILLMALILTSLVSLNSCSSDDDDAPSTASIVGKWYPVNLISNGVNFPYSDHEDCGRDYVVFNNDNTGEFIDIFNCEEDVSLFTYTLNGNKITITRGQESKTATYSISGGKLRLKGQYDFDSDGTIDEVTEIYER